MISIVGVIRVRSLRPAGCKICSFAKFSSVSQSDAGFSCVGRISLNWVVILQRIENWFAECQN